MYVWVFPELLSLRMERESFVAGWERGGIERNRMFFNWENEMFQERSDIFSNGENKHIFKKEKIELCDGVIHQMVSQNI